MLEKEMILQLTPEDLANLREHILAGDRAGFYIAYHNLTGSNEALTQAEISSFSGFPGGVARHANAAVIAELYALGRRSQYPSSVDAFSLEIATDLYEKIAEDVAKGGTGVIADPDMFKAAEAVWKHKGLGKFFPGTPSHGIGAFLADAFGVMTWSAEAADSPALPIPLPVPSGGRRMITPDGYATYVVDAQGRVVTGSVERMPSAPQPFELIPPPEQKQGLTGPSGQGQPAGGILGTRDAGWSDGLALPDGWGKKLGEVAGFAHIRNAPLASRLLGLNPDDAGPSARKLADLYWAVEPFDAAKRLQDGLGAYRGVAADEVWRKLAFGDLPDVPGSAASAAAPYGFDEGMKHWRGIWPVVPGGDRRKPADRRGGIDTTGKRYASLGGVPGLTGLGWGGAKASGGSEAQASDERILARLASLGPEGAETSGGEATQAYHIAGIPGLAGPGRGGSIAIGGGETPASRIVGLPGLAGPGVSGNRRHP
jgi:hypothetical protein